jgi:hypothetical protein
VVGADPPVWGVVEAGVVGAVDVGGVALGPVVGVAGAVVVVTWLGVVWGAVEVAGVVVVEVECVLVVAVPPKNVVCCPLPVTDCPATASEIV